MKHERKNRQEMHEAEYQPLVMSQKMILLVWHYREPVKEQQLRHKKLHNLMILHRYSGTSWLLCWTHRQQKSGLPGSSTESPMCPPVPRKTNYSTWISLHTDIWGYNNGVVRWLSGRASDLRSRSRGFEARPRRCCATTLGKLFTPYCLCHQAV